MTGKDFSGPTPEIRIPERLRLDGDEDQPDAAGPESSAGESSAKKPKPRKKSRTPSANDVEILGDVETFEMDGLNSS